ncbi:hypothetical protein FH972_017182 [Carpinus fangiana]|uniref:Chlorophyll synthase n=1 Tax=Carpinus fangiana TaxID=176857 RepID=A0A5N6RIN3_9ROSI|nr:hypothetical protein FH972_017182 [Carpinus fangiana]
MEDPASTYKTGYLASTGMGSGLWSRCFWKFSLELGGCCQINCLHGDVWPVSNWLYTGHYTNLGVAFGRPWLGWYIRRVGHDFPIVFYLALGGSLLSYIYSAPPLKLKQNGWIGNFALGASYISLPWWAGQALFGTLTPDVIVLTLLYSVAGLGIAIVNDFKSVEGDRALGLQSLPVAFGAETAKWICVGAIDITQISVAGYLLGAGKPYYALALLALIIPQVVFQFQYFLKDPVKYDVKYQVLCGQPIPTSSSPGHPRPSLDLPKSDSRLPYGKRPTISCAWSFGDCFSNQPLISQCHAYPRTLRGGIRDGCRVKSSLNSC